jgi:LacI family transcriptional regulator
VPATLVDIAKETQTSVSTVSRVLAGGIVASRISKETRERIQSAAQKMGYRPNLIARTLRTRRSNTVALLVSDIANPFFAQIGSLIEKNLHQHGYALLLCNSGEDPQRETEHLQLLNQRAIDGLILVPVSRSKEHLMQYLNEKLPLVVLDRAVDGMDRTVYSDQEQSAKLLCSSMKEHGISKVALVCGPSHVLTHRRRCDAVGDCLEIVEKHEGPASRETGRAAFEAFRLTHPAAIVCTNNILAMGVIEAMAQNPIDPQPVIGVFDEIPMMHLLPVPIICSMQDIEKLAESCVAQLLPQLSGEDGHATPIVLPARVVKNHAFEAWQRRNGNGQATNSA